MGVRKHKGIVQSGGHRGKLKKGYKYSGKKLKSGLPQITGAKVGGDRLSECYKKCDHERQKRDKDRKIRRRPKKKRFTVEEEDNPERGRFTVEMEDNPEKGRFTVEEEGGAKYVPPHLRKKKKDNDEKKEEYSWEKDSERERKVTFKKNCPMCEKYRGSKKCKCVGHRPSKILAGSK